MILIDVLISDEMYILYKANLNTYISYFSNLIKTIFLLKPCEEDKTVASIPVQFECFQREN
jgi:hypothetical protein